MESYLGAAGGAFAAVFSWPGILIPIAGTMIAMTTSFLPGIGSSSLMALVVVLTIGWDPVSTMMLFGALTGGATFMGSITAILFNIPGSAPSAAALLDGYPLGRKGYPQMAIACAATASAVGSVIGVIVLMAILPFMRPVLLAFGPFEMFLLGIWGLATLVAIPNTSPVKALAMAVLGLLVAMIGSDPTSGDPRWNFGSLEILQGIPIVPALLGLFTFAEMISWVKRYALDEASLFRRQPDDSALSGVLAVFRHYALTIRSAIIGTAIGIIPGVGGTVASFVAYGQATQTVKDPDAQFGKGDIRGLIAPESAVDAKDGGSLLPVVAFGLPGSESGVILIAVMAIHGIVPGVPMLTEDLPLTYVLVFSLLFSNIVTSFVGVGLSPLLARLTELRIDRIVLPALVISLLAVVQLDSEMSDVFLALGFGVAGYFFKRNDWPRVPFIIAFVLGEFLESNFVLSLRLIELDRVEPLARPASLAIAALIVLSLWWMLRRRRARTKPAVAGDDFTIALILCAGSVVLFLWALTGERGYSPFAIGMSLASSVILAITSVLAGRSRGWRLSLSVPRDHHLPLGAMLALPALAVLLGLPAALGTVVAVWLLVADRRSTASVLRALGWGLATGVATHFFIARFAYLLLPEGLIWDLFS